MGCSDARPAPERGFVLAVTLWILAGIAAVVALMTLWALDEVRTATADRTRVEDRVAAINARETLLYLAATRDITRAGISVRGLDESERAVMRLDEFSSGAQAPRGDELRMDGRVYAAPGGIRMAVQDESALVPLVWPRPEAVDGLLRAVEVPDTRIPRLRDALLDYMDADGLERLDGAEAAAYRAAARPAPPGRRLLVPSELFGVLGWDGFTSAQRRRLLDWATPYYAGPINLNMVPAELLPSVLPGCPDQCAALVRQRDERVFESSLDVQARTGLALPGDPFVDYRYAPSDTFRVTLWGQSGGGWRMHVRLTPLADGAGPWTVLAAYPISRPPDDAPAPIPESDLFADPPSGGSGGDVDRARGTVR